jgi:hypothetical protein
MWIKEEVTSGYDLEARLWGQACGTWREIIEAGKEDQAMQYFEEIFCGEEAINITSINDILAYDNDDLMEYLGLNEEDKEYYITEEEFAQLKENGVLSEEHLQVIQETFDLGCHAVTIEEFNNEGELSDEEKEELDRVVA